MEVLALLSPAGVPRVLLHAAGERSLLAQVLRDGSFHGSCHAERDYSAASVTERSRSDAEHAPERRVARRTWQPCRSNRVSSGWARGYRWGVDAASAVAVRTQYQARPGRRAIVVTDLASLRGPVRGTVELPLRLFWSSPNRTFDLGKPFMRRWLYQTVLREASRPDDLIGYLDRGTLISLWPDLRLPAGVRQAWEDRHPVLRAAAAGSG